MDDYLKEFRHKIQHCWSEKTVSPKFLPIDTAKPASLGQCAPTSQVLLDALRETYPSDNFTLAIGEVRKAGEAIIPYHVWVVEILESPKDNRVIDLTGDQSEMLPKIVYATAKELAEEGIYYISYEQSHQKRFIHSEAVERYELLKQKYVEVEFKNKKG